VFTAKSHAALKQQLNTIHATQFPPERTGFSSVIYAGHIHPFGRRCKWWNSLGEVRCTAAQSEFHRRQRRHNRPSNQAVFLSARHGPAKTRV
jgi:Cu/Zn superoxide dismutase